MSDDPEAMRWAMAQAESEAEARFAVLRDLYAEAAARLEYERTKSSFEIGGWKQRLLRELDRRMGW